MPDYIRAQQSGGTFFFTLATHRRQKILLERPVIIALRDSFQDVMRENPFTAVAWVLLPDHMHFIWTLPDGDTDYSRKWGRVKAGVSRRLGAHYQYSTPTTRSRIKRRESVIWQRRFWEHQIRDDDDLKVHMDYLHYNPVRHGLVSAVREWPHSSFFKFMRQGMYGEGWGVGADFGVDVGVCVGE